MKNRDQILEAIKSGKKSKCIDGRDFQRLATFFPEEDLKEFGFSPKDGVEYKPQELTRENVLSELQSDLAFGFKKALNQRGISSGLMYEVVKLWMWVLDDKLADHDTYPMYGLPLFKAVAVKYGFENEIGDDSGSEQKYNINCKCQ